MGQSEVIVPVFDHPKAVISFVENGLWQGGKHFGPATGIGFANAQEGLISGLVYHNYSPDQGTLEISAYSSNRQWLNRHRLNIIFAYPFEQMKCRIVCGRFSEKNKRVIRIWKALGAHLTKIPDIRAEGEAEIVGTINVRNWRKSRFRSPFEMPDSPERKS